MPFLDTSSLKVVERLPGWKGRFFHTATMTFADYEFMSGSTIHEHFHPEEEVYEVIAGELEVSVDAITKVVRPGIVARVRIEAVCALHGCIVRDQGLYTILRDGVRPVGSTLGR